MINEVPCLDARSIVIWCIFEIYLYSKVNPGFLNKIIVCLIEIFKEKESLKTQFAQFYLTAFSMCHGIKCSQKNVDITRGELKLLYFEKDCTLCLSLKPKAPNNNCCKFSFLPWKGLKCPENTETH